jgi:hypothetical protein
MGLNSKNYKLGLNVRRGRGGHTYKNHLLDKNSQSVKVT